MKAFIFLNGSGAVLIVTSHDSHTDPTLLRKLEAKGITKYVCFEVPIDAVRQRYGGHFDVVMGDLREEDDLRVMDFDGRRIFDLFSFKEMGQPYFHETKPR